MNLITEIQNIYKIITSHPLTRTSPIRTLCRLLRFQIKSRLTHSLTDWVAGLKLDARPGTGLTGNVYCGLFEFEEMAFVLHYLRQDDLFADVGANVGVFTLLASGVCKCPSVSFEPIPSTFKKLCNHIKINNLEDKVRCINQGVAEKQGTLLFSNSQNDCLNHIIPSGTSETDVSTVQVPVTTLDQVFENAPAPTLIKMDIEGYELFALQGATHLAENPTLNVIILECTPVAERYEYSRDKIFNFMDKYRFKAFSYTPFTRRLYSVTAPGNHDNVIFIRDIEKAIERINAAPPIKIFNHTI